MRRAFLAMVLALVIGAGLYLLNMAFGVMGDFYRFGMPKGSTSNIARANF